MVGRGRAPQVFALDANSDDEPEKLEIPNAEIPAPAKVGPNEDIAPLPYTLLFAPTHQPMSSVCNPVALPRRSARNLVVDCFFPPFM